MESERRLEDRRRYYFLVNDWTWPISARLSFAIMKFVQLIIRLNQLGRRPEDSIPKTPYLRMTSKELETSGLPE